MIRNWWSLVAKDLWLHRWVIPLLLALEVASYVTFVVQFPEPMRSGSALFLQGLTSIGTFMLGYRLLASEENVGALAFLKSLPLTNSEIYWEKVTFLWSYVVANAASINVVYLIMRPLFPTWNLDPLDVAQVVGGVAVQLLFATVLIWVATWADSQKAIWIPFPLLLIMINLYTMLLSPTAPDNVVLHAFRSVADYWFWWSLGGIALTLAAGFVIVEGLRRKRSLIG